MASIRKRGPYQWEARIRRKGWPIQCKTFERKQDAEEWARDIESEIDRGIFSCRKEAENTTLTEALDRYAREVTPHKKGAQQELARIARWKQQPLSQAFLATIRGADLAKYRDDRLSEGKSSNTVRLELAVISHLFNIARKEWGMESLSNPAQNIRMPSNSRPRDRRLVDDEEERLRHACRESKSKGLEAIVILAIETAMRQGELLGLEWKNVDFKRRIAHLPYTKNNESRDVPLSSRAIEVLKARPRDIKSNKVFYDWKRNDSLGNSWRRAVKRAAIEGLRFHDLRHEATSRLFERGLNIMEVATITGHKDLKMLKRYTHLKAEDLARKLG